MSSLPTTVLELLEAGAPGATALSTPGGAPLTYEALRQLARDTLSTLNARGIGRNDRVAIVLDNGPEMAAAFVSVAAGATAAPLNPGYRADEFEFYLRDLNAKLLIIERDKASPAIDVANKLGIPIARVAATREHGAGGFTLNFPEGQAALPPARLGAASVDDIALVLHTSGTTSRPKIVPLAQRNVCASARNVRQTLAFAASDRGLNIMPLFHIHGLIAGILAPLSAGGEVCCTTGFNALKFFSWMAEVRPTWYTAVPTMHQGILSRAANNVDVIRANPLRFIRSSSSSMPTQVIKELEAVFGAPVIESYGMTEAAHQMASNPLPPDVRKPGTVGVHAGPEVCVIDPDGNPLPPGVTGEIAIRGENVMSGYENNQKANAEAFTKGWFRTGDQGVMDADGYLYDHRPLEGDHQSWRREDLAARSGRGTHGSPGSSAMRHVCRSTRQAGRRRCRGGGSAGGRAGQREGPAGVRREARGGLQGPAQDTHRCRDSQGRDRETATHRARPKAGTRAGKGKLARISLLLPVAEPGGAARAASDLRAQEHARLQLKG